MDSPIVYANAETPPSFAGGSKAMQEWVGNNLRYPIGAQKSGIHGTVIIGVLIEPDGTVTHAHILKSVCDSIDAEAIRLVRNMPKWIPGKHKGEKVRMKSRISVRFSL